METVQQITKPCLRCKADKPLDAFGSVLGEKRATCKACRAASQRFRNHHPELKRPPRSDVMTCTTCGVPKPQAEFRRRQCYDCIKNRRATYSLKTLYGVTPERYDALIKRQGGVCAICKGTNGRKRLAVDHCHVTGIVRGLLCDSCNLSIGKLGDTLDAVERAAQYMRTAYATNRRLFWTLAEGLVHHGNN